MKVTSNTVPVIALAKINCLSILKTMFSEILIPPVVYRELSENQEPSGKK